MNLAEIGQRMRWLAEENCSNVKVCYGELDYEKLFNVIYDIPIGSQFSSGGRWGAAEVDYLRGERSW